LGLIFTNIPKTLGDINLGVNDVLHAVEGGWLNVLDVMAQGLTQTIFLVALSVNLGPVLYVMEKEL